MTARTMPSVIGIIALLVLTFQIGKTFLNLRNRDQGREKISEVDPRSSTETSAPLPTIAPLGGCAFFWPVHRLN